MSVRVSFSLLLRHPTHLLAFGFGAGLASKAPGTFGSMVALPIYYFAQALPVAGYAALVAAMFIVGIAICANAERALGVHDHPGIVWDEIVGLLATLFMVPPGWLWVAVGFGLFRLFDIWKPFPISWINRHVGGGLGIMLDDLAAALCAALGLHAAYHIWMLS